MKKIVLFALAVSMMLALASCAKNPRCTLDAAKEKMAAEETVIAYVYDDEKSYEVKTEALEAMLTGEWTESSLGTDSEKVLSVTVGLQYEVCFFDDGTAMIYSGLAGIFQRDRTYYSVKTDVSLDEICSTVRESGEEVAEAEDNNAPSAE